MDIYKFSNLDYEEDGQSYQERLAFKKELNILRNDFYYRMIDSKELTLVDFMYRPLDGMSGDAYTARRLDEHRTFYLIVDGMGKGLSASLTTMIMTTFVNHIIDKMLEFDSFSLDILVKESMDFIKPILLDEETLCLDYIVFNAYFETLSYAKFSMPPFLLQNRDGDVVKLKSNNVTLSKWSTKYKIDEYNVADIEKFLFFSDGIVENMTKGDYPYSEDVVEDFLNSFTREEFKNKMFEKFKDQEDDLTLIFLNKLNLNSSTLIEKKEFGTSLEDVEEANEWYEGICSSLTNDMRCIAKAGIVFNELFMNAYEHGNLGIDTRTKHRLIELNEYTEELLRLEKECELNIWVEIYKVHNKDQTYIITQIIDEGDGFDTQILSETFRNSQKFNGRGVYLSRKNSMGIYFNSKGNKVLFLTKI